MTLAPVSPHASAEARLLLRTLYRGGAAEVRFAMKEIASRREEMTPHLVALLDRANANLEHPDIDYTGTGTRDVPARRAPRAARVRSDPPAAGNG